jgi:hypothetical protein
MRLANIRRNAEMLKELGLDTPTSTKQASSHHRRSSASSSSTKRGGAASASAPERSSKRLRNESTEGKKLPPRPPPQPTFAAEQAEAASYKEPFAGTLDAITHERDGQDDVEPDKLAKRRVCLAALTSSGTTAKQRSAKKPQASSKPASSRASGSSKKLAVGEAKRSASGHSAEWVGGFTLSSADDVVKVVPGRVYSVAVLPRNDVVALAAGDKYGNVGISWGPTGVEETAVFLPHVRAVSGILARARSPLAMHTSSYDGQVRCTPFTPPCASPRL